MRRRKRARARRRAPTPSTTSTGLGRVLAERRRSNAAGIHAKPRDRRNERRRAIERAREEG